MMCKQLPKLRLIDEYGWTQKNDKGAKKSKTNGTQNKLKIKKKKTK